MAVFELRRDKTLLEKAIKEATDFIDIVSFQFTSEKIIRLLVIRATQGVRIRIITLPEDSYRDVTEREKIAELYNLLSSKGVELNRCIWEVGVPELTETSLSGEMTEGGGNKWYALHGKFVVTDKEALAVSTNFTEEKQLESYLLYNDKKIIKYFSEKFEKIKDLFCSKQEDLPGSLYFQLPKEIQQEIKSLYERTKRINVKDYPPIISPDAEIEKGLFLSPFEGRARTFLNAVIEQAEEFIYLSTERLFDDQAVKKLLSKAYMTDIPMKILTGHPRAVRQNSAKAEKMVADLMAAGVEFAIIDDVHAKVWITEKYICVGSANIGKMNLGFSKTRNYWRANTETLWFDNNSKIISAAKDTFDKVFQGAKSGIVAFSDVGTKEKRAKDLFSLFGFRSKKEAKILMARIETQLSVQNRKNVIRIAKLSARLAEIENNHYITEENVIMANILFYLRERKHDLDEIEEKMVKIVDKKKIINAIQKLQERKYISKEHEYYTINIERLLIREESNHIYST